MRGRYIDFISSYCDGWCERCAFTDRCSVYAVQIALEMCDGNEEEAIQLAVGPPPPRSAAEAKRRERWAEEMASIVPSEQELAEFEREDEACEDRVAESPVTTASERAWLLSHRWLRDQAERVTTGASGGLAEAIEVATHDCFFIHAKVHRALSGHDRATHGLENGHRIQNDWNGSAKVALISITRSTTAWDLIADATQDPDAAQIAAELRVLQRHLESAFPKAWKFRRPGFDAPLRKFR